MSTAATSAPAQLPCPKCQAPVPYFDEANSTHFVCPQCESYFEATDDKPARAIGKFNGAHAAPVLPVGAVGTLRGQQYRVTGWMQRRESKTIYQWQEYMLRHEETGIYAQLAVYEGHWMLVGPAAQSYKVQMRQIVETPETTYNIYNKYQVQILYAGGEFDWDIREDEQLTVTEYIAPPHMLVQEKRGKTEHWYKGLHLEPREIADGFGIPSHQLPYRNGVGAVQPPPGEAAWPALRNFTLSMALLIVFTQLAFLVIKPEKQVLALEFSSGRDTTSMAAVAEAQAAGSNRVIVSKPFAVDGPAALEFRVGSSLANQWLEVPVTLVNEQTGQQYEFTKNLEFYSGVEDGESWSEGDPAQDATLAKIPTGRYHLNLYPVTENGQDLPLRLQVSQHTPLHSNAVLALLALLVYPGLLYWWRSYHEQQRWQNSDYGPQ
ncbi:DUF4178 domain-containing protein [Hymenobacter guriensis]|uniref:DUF4178 domain-containing protein n=1 Tax=Hymenobacter guriensis TaxID=2793065 RepID=A0ABS0L8E2_9BACT|nr:DUF4178 domain-containing protein [Hymenobacter guriensis]MBG8555617.1 DUF4178 domain-containing protein [Hymenobacter guriensis]